MKWKVILGVVVAMFAYAVLIGVGFHFIETSNENSLQPVAYQQLTAFLSKYPCLNTTDIHAMSNIIKRFQEGGLQIGTPNNPLFNITNWDIRAAIFLSFQIVGAIGYDNAPPRTIGGRAFCVVFAIIGIPLFILASFGIGDMLVQLWHSILKKLKCHPMQTGRPEVYSQLIRLLAMFLIGMIFFAIIPAVIFTVIESWSFGDSFYYTLTTVLTIGFGDFVPGATIDGDIRNWYRMAVGFWILITLLWFTATWTSVRYVLKTNLNDDEPEKSPPTDEEPPKLNFINVEMSAPDAPITPQDAKMKFANPAAAVSMKQGPAVARIDDNWKYPFSIANGK